VQACRFGVGPAQDNKVEDPAIAAHSVLAVGDIFQPTKRKARCRRTGTRNVSLGIFPVESSNPKPIRHAAAIAGVPVAAAAAGIANRLRKIGDIVDVLET